MFLRKEKTTKNRTIDNPQNITEIIMDHYEHPRIRGLIDDDSYQQVNMNSDTCIDNLDIYVKISSNIIEDICFDGEACAISTSSVSIMIKNLIGKTVDEAKEFVREFECMLEEEEYDEALLNEANAYNEIYKQGNRKHCAFLPYEGIKKILNEYSF